MSQRKSDTLKTYADLMEECGLLVKAEFFGQEDTHPEVLTYDSREVTENTMFICKGAAFKEEYLTSAVEKGAILYISEKEYDTGKDIPHIKSEAKRS